MREALAIISLLILAISAAAQDAKQDIEYGQKLEMRGAKIVFIDSGTNLDFREHAIKVLARELPEITISERLDKGVDLILQLNIDSQGDRKGSATMLVLTRSSRPNSVRIIAKYEDSKSSIWTFKLSTVLTRRFIRDYLEVNPRR